MTEPTTPVVVTDDAALLADLRAKLDELGSHKLAEYAFSLGLYPPGYTVGQPESISEYRPPNTDTTKPGLLVWDSTFPDSADEDDDEEDAEDVWDDASPSSQSRPSSGVDWTM